MMDKIFDFSQKLPNARELGLYLKARLSKKSNAWIKGENMYLDIGEREATDNNVQSAAKSQPPMPSPGRMLLESTTEVGSQSQSQQEAGSQPQSPAVETSDEDPPGQVATALPDAEDFGVIPHGAGQSQSERPAENNEETIEIPIVLREEQARPSSECLPEAESSLLVPSTDVVDQPSGSEPEQDAAGKGKAVEAPQAPQDSQPAETSTAVPEISTSASESAETIVDESHREADSNSEIYRTAMCFWCTKPLASEHNRDPDREREAYLPCGHVFGHRCLRTYIASGNRRCPLAICRLTLRHRCEHLAAPTLRPWNVPWADNTVAALPWECEFCCTTRGRKLRHELEAYEIKLRDEKRKIRLEGPGARFPGWRPKITWYQRRLEVLENKLEDEQA